MRGVVASIVSVFTSRRRVYCGPQYLFCFGRRPLPFGGSHLRLPSGPAGIRTTTGSLSALARPTPYQLSHRVAYCGPQYQLLVQYSLLCSLTCLDCRVNLLICFNVLCMFLLLSQWVFFHCGSGRSDEFVGVVVGLLPLSAFVALSGLLSS